MAGVKVIDSSPIAVRLAAMIGAGLAWSVDDLEPDDAVIKVVSTIDEVLAVDQAVRNGAKVAAAVAWNLAESALAELLMVNVPCIIGEPTAEHLRHVIRGGGDGIDREEERDDAARFDALEKWLLEPSHDARQSGAATMHSLGPDGRLDPAATG